MELTVKPETCWNAVWLPAEESKLDSVHERKHQLKKYEDTTNSFLKQNIWSTDPRLTTKVFDLIDMRKVLPRNHVTGRWVLTIKTDKQGNFLKAKTRWLLRGFQDKQKEYQQMDSPPSTRPRFRMSCQMAASKGRNIFHIDLKTAFLQGQSYDVNREILCQLPPEAGHPPKIAARLKNSLYILDKAPTRAERCCYVLYSTQ